MRSFIAITISTVFALTASSASAMQRGQAHAPKVKPTTPSSTVKATAPKPTMPKGSGSTHAAGPKSQGAPKVHATGPKATHGGGVSAKTTHGGGAPTKSAKSAKPATTSTAVASSKKTRSTTTTATGETTLTPVQQKLRRNTNLASKLEGRLPAGTDLMRAADGFRNLGQFVAAVNVSNNLGIPFADLKMRMVDDGMSLGQAIKAERPKVDGAFEARRAESDATRLVESTDPSLVTNTTTTKTKNKTKTKGQQ